jgi:hypothetical protein
MTKSAHIYWPEPKKMADVAAREAGNAVFPGAQEEDTELPLCCPRCMNTERYSWPKLNV